ncbi:MAG: hypothetical protein JW901_02745, partial [Dehalococcoidia bacterium]|nr:hypothetical protein [Dehalococcoidia bacterium]
ARRAEGGHYAAAARVAAELVQRYERAPLTQPMLLNVNVPDLDLRDIPGIDVTKLGEKVYSAGIETGYDGRHEYYWIQHRAVDMEDASGTDLWALKHRRISITPLRFNRSEYSTEFVHEMAPALCRRLLGKK